MQCHQHASCQDTFMRTPTTTHVNNQNLQGTRNASLESSIEVPTQNHQSKPEANQLQEVPTLPPVNAPSDHHERLVTTTAENPGQQSGRRSGVDRSPHLGGPQDGKDHVRQDPHRPIIPGSLEHQSTHPLQCQQQDSPPQDDHVHQAEQAPVTPKSHAAPKGLAMRPKAKAMPMMAEGSEGTVENPWVEADDPASPGQDAQHGKCIATDSPTSGAQSCRAISDDAHRRRVERSLEQLKAEKLSCDSALTAGEIDTCDEFQMNKEKQFWQLFEQL